MPLWHWFLFLATALISALMTFGVRHFVLLTKLGLRVPRQRDIHARPTPSLGGVAITLSFLLVAGLVYFFNPSALSFVPETLGGMDRNLLGIFGGVMILLLVGIWDDIYGLNPGIKLFFHFLAGLVLTLGGVLVAHLTNPLGGHILLGSWTYLIVILWIVFLINVVNFLDGLDGLASGVSLIATLILYLLAIKPSVNQLSLSLLAIILSGSLLGFLPFNFYPARIFMGDSGSQVLGFLLAVFSIISGGKLATAFLVLGVPMLDVLWVVMRRLLTKQPIYKADRFHLHHRLLNAGLSQRGAVVLLYTVSAGFGIVALQTQTIGKLIASLFLIGLMFIGGVLLVLFSTLQTKSANSDNRKIEYRK